MRLYGENILNGALQLSEALVGTSKANIQTSDLRFRAFINSLKAK